jgi:hypothetical protein
MDNIHNQGQVNDSQPIEQLKDAAAQQDEANELGFKEEGKNEEPDLKD